MIAMSRAVFREDAPDGFRTEQAPGSASRLKQQAFDFLQLWAGKPVGPWSWESHLLAMDSRFGQKVGYCFLQNKLARLSFNLLSSGYSRGKFHKWMVEKWNAAFNRGGHTHLVLLHQQLDQVAVDIGIEQAMQQVARSMSGRALPGAHRLFIALPPEIERLKR